jgi:hypothetical protein
MTEHGLPEELSSHPLTLTGGTPDELVKAGKYDWVSYYSKLIIQSKSYSLSDAVEIVLLNMPYQELTIAQIWPVSAASAFNMASVLMQYDRPEIGDALRFGAQYPELQRTMSIVIPHEPWTAPDRAPSFVLVLRSAEGQRGISYVPHSALLIEQWWAWRPCLAVRRRKSLKIVHTTSS